MERLDDTEVKQVSDTPSDNGNEEYITLENPEGEVKSPSESSSEKEPIKPEESNLEDQVKNEDSKPDSTLPTEVKEEKIDEPPIKRLTNESDVEYARRLEIKRLKDEVRAYKQKMSIDKKSEVIVDKEDDLSKYDKNQIKEMENILTKLGYVKKTELEQNEHKRAFDTVFNDFLEQHQEYKPENDVDDIKWSSFLREWESGLYNTATKDPKVLRQIFSTIHQKLSPAMPKETINKAVVQAQEKKINSASVSGTTVTPNKKDNTPKGDPKLAQYLQGYTEEELTEMFGK